MNLLTETKRILKENNKTKKDVLCVGDGINKMTWDEFKNRANFIYDNGWGSAEISKIIVYGDGFWLERGEYDGSEWWEYRTAPIIPEGNNIDKIKIKVD